MEKYFGFRDRGSKEINENHLRLIYILTHPIQYYSPLFAWLVKGGLTLEVWYCDEHTAQGAYDHEFNTRVQWDTPLLQGYRFRFFPNKGKGKTKKRGFGAYDNPALVQALQEQPPSWIIVPGWNYKTYVSVLQKATGYGHRLAFRGETNFEMEANRPRFKQLFRKKILKAILAKVDAYLYIGTNSKLFYTEFLKIDKPLLFAPYAVDNQRFQQQATIGTKEAARKSWKLEKEDFVLVYSGKFIEKKRPLDLLKAFAIATVGYPHFRLLMVGDGPLLSDLQSAIRDHKLENQVRLTGFLNQSEISIAYRAADVLVMCSDFGETWGLSVNEAMNFSMPVILSDRVGSAPDLATPSNGWIFPCGNIERLAEVILEAGCLAKPTLASMGQASLLVVNRYDFDENLKAFKLLENY